MRSWVFRHRARLEAIYGRRPLGCGTRASDERPPRDRDLLVPRPRRASAAR